MLGIVTVRTFTAALILLACWASPAMAQRDVDIELVIAVDVSGSMGRDEHDMQRRGFLSAFADQQLLKAISSGIRGRIAVTYIEWAGNELQHVLVPWHMISHEQSAAAFREMLKGKPRSPIRGTSISSALAFASRLFDNNGFESFRRVIDVSGDGPNKRGPDIRPVRESVLRKGIIINGLPIMLAPAMYRGPDGYGLDDYFRDCVIGGPSSFVYPVWKKTELAEAIRRKLILEISGRPARIFRASKTVRAATPRVDCEMARYDDPDW